ncbi:hypothetical protein [Streptacidiphilus neutrinimicus]|uniref:hypothetical protein n=1 Tax=Streptacidiphilus neutrinimicus TaxID=105420 RepID=UPI0005A8B685|nr:hypothetical protein [Streptacidiphilus neutrinimicus]
MVAVLAAALVGFWGWALHHAGDSPVFASRCPEMAPADARCLTEHPARVASLTPIWKHVLGLGSALGPSYGVRLAGLASKPRTVYFEEDDYVRLDMQPGEVVTVTTLGGNVVEVRDKWGSTYVDGLTARGELAWVLGPLPAVVLLLLFARMGRRRIRSGRARLLLRGAGVAGAGGLAICGALMSWSTPTWGEALAFVLSGTALLTAEVAAQSWRRVAFGHH